MASVETGEHVRIISSASAIQKHYSTKDDVLPFLLKEFGFDGNAGLVLTGVSGLTVGFDSEDAVGSPEESRRERTLKWRKQVDRGPRAREFSLQVRQADDYRCLFSGERFPKLPIFDSAGVDGAHILPWSAHQLNAVANGICLCKRCHWAFDNGLLHLDFDAAANAYLLSIPGAVEALAKSSNFDLHPFHASVGQIDVARLPKNKKFWPSPKFIQELNRSG